MVRTVCSMGVCFALLLAIAPAYGQHTEFVTGFETDREGVALPFQPGSYNPLQVVMFQDPREAVVTATNIVSDTSPDADTSGILPATEESFVANFVADSFLGAGGSNQSLDIRFQWANSNGNRWCLVETLQSPFLGDPSLHLNGIVRMKINLPLVTSEFPALTYTDRIGVALLVRETGNDIPQGRQDGGDGPLEFVGVSTVGFADTDSPVPVPTTFIDGPTTGDAYGWADLVFDLDAIELAGNVQGWTFNDGDGVLDAGTNGDGVNRGVLAGIVLTVDNTDVLSNYVEFLVDNIEFEAPVVDPVFTPSVGAPVAEGQTVVRVKDILSSATDIQLEIDRVPASEPFTADDTLNSGDPAGALFWDFNVSALAVGDRIRARQTNASGNSDYSIVLEVTPPAAFSFTLALDENGVSDANADFEFVGAASKIGGAPQGKPVYSQTGQWQNVEFSLIPGVEPVLDFAGGNGLLQPDGGNYSIDSIFFSIDPTVPYAGPYEVYVDHLYYIDDSDQEQLITGVDGIGNPFPLFRGQSTAPVGSRSSTVTSDTSYDGAESNLITWTWPDTLTSNLTAPYRPNIAFPDSAKAVGMWLLVQDASTNAVPPPSVAGPVIGDVDGVVVDITTVGVTSTELFLNGASIGVINTTGVASVTYDTTAISFVLGDQLAATQTTAMGTSDLSLPRVVSLPPGPAIQSPVRSNDTSVVVTDVLDVAFSTASLVTLFTTNGVIGTAAPTGATATVPIAPQDTGTIIWATQTVNGLESPQSPSVTVNPSGICVTVFSDDMDTGAGWTVNATADTAWQFGWDYSSMGIPPSPNGGGSTTGLRMAANLSAGAANYVMATPTALSMSGIYQIRFDFWINANGPFPGGGGGSTEFCGGGVGYDGITPGLNGASLAITGEAGSSRDWRLYKDAGEQFIASGQYDLLSNNHTDPELIAQFPGQQPPLFQQTNYAQQTGTTLDGAGGFAWHEMVITVDSANGTANFTVDGLSIGTINANIGSTVAMSGNVQVLYMDIFTSVSDNVDLSFGVVDNFQVLTVQQEPITFGDWDGDADVDLVDFASFADCLSGPGGVPAPTISECVDACINTFDFDADGDVDMMDASAFMDAFTG